MKSRSNLTWMLLLHLALGVVITGVLFKPVMSNQAPVTKGLQNLISK